MSYLLFIIIVNLFHNLIIKTQNTLNCLSKYNDCFNCSVCGDEQSCYCNWDQNTKTCNTGQEKILSLDFYNYFTTCKDDNSNSIISKYCGNSVLEVDDNDEIKLNIPKNDGFFGTQNLYCEYIYTAFDKKEIYYRLKYGITSNENIEKIYLYIKITYNDETSSAGYLSKKEFDRNFDSIKQIKIAIYFTKGLKDIPFSLAIERIGDKVRAALYITIAFIILACLLCALVIYCLSKKISENARLRQRTLFELAMARQRGEYNNNDDVASETDIEEENRKKIKILLKTTLAAKKFIKKYGIKDGNTCTICIEEFKENRSKVSITPCNHVFHYKCLTNWLVKNVKNPKCPNCNHNLVSDIDIKNGGIQTIEVARNPIPNLETQYNNNVNNNNLSTNENRLITRNVTRSRSRVNNQNSQNTYQNGVENGGNINEVEIQNI